MVSSLDVAIVGAGLAGLSAAVSLQRSGKNVQIFEASGYAGGRVSTEVKEGFLLDRGFQILLTAYSECNQLDMASLDLHSFINGALIWKNGRFRRMVNPFCSFKAASDFLHSGLITKSDILKIAPIYLKIRYSKSDKLLSNHGATAEKMLRRLGLSKELTESFLEPFFRGILLDNDLQCSGKLVLYILKMFLQGDASIPAKGMKAIPQQLESKLNPGTIKYNTKVKCVEPHLITLEDGQKVAAKAVLLACGLWGQAEVMNMSKPLPGNSTYSLYFAAEQSPVKEGILILNGENTGIITNMSVISDVAPSYAPPGASLISVSVIPNPHKPLHAPIDNAVRANLHAWFGPIVKGWKLLKTFHIQNAHPSIYPVNTPYIQNPYRLQHGIWQCGDFLEAPTIQSALKTGREASEEIVRRI